MPTRPLACFALTTAALAITAAPAAAGPATEAVRIDDLVAVAVQQSATLARARADRSIAQAEADASGIEQDLITTAALEYKKTQVGDDVEPSVVQLYQDSKITGQVGLAKKVGTGARVSAQLGLQQSSQEYSISELFTLNATDEELNDAEFVDNAQASATLRIEQPLVRGFGDVSAAKQRRARLAAEGANVKAQLTAEEMLRDLVIAYWELAYSAHELQIRQQSLALAKTQYQVTQDAKRAGAVGANALKAVEYQIAVREEAMLRAQLEVEAKSLELRRIAGLEVSRRDLVLIPGERFEIDDKTWDIEDALDLALADNPRLQVLLADKRLADLDVDVARDSGRPQLDLALEGSLFGDGATTGEAVGGLGAGGGYQVSASLNFQFEVGGSHAGANRAASERRAKVVLDAVDLRRMIETEAVQAVHAVTAAQQRAKLADKAIDVAADNVDAERASFLAARTTNFQVMQRQDDLVDAHLRKGRAIADYHEAVAKLEFLTGGLLEHYRVEVRKPSRR